MMDEKENKERKDRKIGYIVIALVLLFIALFILLFLNGSETRISDEDNEEDVSVVHCTTGKIEDGFFVSKIANSSTNEIKVTFRNNKLDKLYYSFLGVYRSEDVAKEEDVNFHSIFYQYMGDNNLPVNYLNPNFSVVNTKYHFTLYVESLDRINEITSRFFFIDKEDLEKLNSYSLDTLKSYYENKGFGCNVV